MEEVGLHVAPHVWEPPELVHGPEQEVIALVLLRGPWKTGGHSGFSENSLLA